MTNNASPNENQVPEIHLTLRLGLPYQNDRARNAGNMLAPRPHARRMVIRTCRVCGSYDTPLWRDGPLGPRTLCNACGLGNVKDEKKRADNRRREGGGHREEGGGNSNAAAVY